MTLEPTTSPKRRKIVLCVICIWIILGHSARIIVDRCLPFRLWLLVYSSPHLTGFIDVASILVVVLSLLVIYTELKGTSEEKP